MEPAAECRLALIGATPKGKKELIGFRSGMREDAQSPLSGFAGKPPCRSTERELIADIKGRGLAVAPETATATPRSAF